MHFAVHVGSSGGGVGEGGKGGAGGQGGRGAGGGVGRERKSRWGNIGGSVWVEGDR